MKPTTGCEPKEKHTYELFSAPFINSNEKYFDVPFVIALDLSTRGELTNETVSAIGLALLELLPKEAPPASLWQNQGRLVGVSRRLGSE